MKTIAARAKVCERVVQTALKKAAPWLIEVKRRLRNTSIITVKLQAIKDWWLQRPKGDAEDWVEPATPPLENPSSLDLRKDPPMGAQICNSGGHEAAPPASSAPPEPKRPTDFNAHLDALIEQVKAASAARPDDSRLDLPKPEIEGWMTSMQRAFIRQYRSFITLDPAQWPKAFDESVRSLGTSHPPLNPELLTWLRNQYGGSGNYYGFRHMSKAKHKKVVWIGFTDPDHAFEFKMNWK